MNTVVVIDDEMNSLESMVKFLERSYSDFKVVAKYTSAIGALEYIIENKPNVVITDIKMPDMSGIELIKRIRCANIDSKIIILSGYSEFEYAKEAIKYRVFEYLLKPVDITELKQTFTRLREELSEEGEITLADMKREQFMVELCMGMYTSYSVFEREFSRLDFNYKIDEIQGVVAEFIISDFENFKKNIWLYEYDSLSRMISNVLKMSCEGIEVYFAAGSGGKFTAVVIAKDREPDFDVIKAEFAEVLKTECDINIIFRFSDAKSLITRNFVVYNKDEYEMLISEYAKSKGDAEGCEDVMENEDEFSERIRALVDEIKEYINDNINEDLSRGDVAAHVHLNETYIGRIFKQYSGKSIHEYHMSLRIKRAIDLLAQNEKIGYIGKVLGYDDNRKFIRNFKSYTGYTPSEYKRIFQQDTASDDERNPEL